METQIEQLGKMDASNCDALLERAQEQEAELGIKFEQLSANYDRKERLLKIFCEIRPQAGTKLKCNINLIAVVYDKNDRIVDRDTTLILKDDFYSFDVKEIHLYEITPKKLDAIKKIKFYPVRF